MYPGDPSAHPANVYNCRCTQIARVNGHEIEGSEIYKNNHASELEGISWEEWKNGKQKKQRPPQSQRNKKKREKTVGNDNVTHKGRSDIIKPSDTISNRIIHSLTKRANYKSGSMTSEEYVGRKRELESVKGLKQIWLPKEEYAMVKREFNRYMSDEDRKHALVSKPIRNYVYTIINYGFNNYVVVGKVKIK